MLGIEARGQFPKFEGAAHFAIDTYRNDQFLIRHTEREPEFIPLVATA